MARSGTLLARIALVCAVCVAGCDCRVDVATRSFPIDDAEAAQLLDADGRSIPSACQRVCDELQRVGDPRFDAGVGDAALSDGGFSALPGLAEPTAFACEVVSVDAMLQVRCHWHYTYLCWG